MRDGKEMIIKAKRILFSDNDVVQLFVVDRRPDGLKVETFKRRKQQTSKFKSTVSICFLLFFKIRFPSSPIFFHVNSDVFLSINLTCKLLRFFLSFNYLFCPEINLLYFTLMQFKIACHIPR
jgi:hypothetical protein